MKICLPVEQLNGLESEISPSFRTAPALLMIDSDSHECVGIDASAGSCGATPMEIDAIICAGGLGRGMFNGLRMRGIQVFNTEAVTVAEALAGLSAGRLVEVTEVACCGGGHHEHGERNDHQHAGSCGCSSTQGEEKSGCGCGHH
jgi:predicted Fe-Mo cluster-binding NifX family protein